MLSLKKTFKLGLLAGAIALSSNAMALTNTLSVTSITGSQGFTSVTSATKGTEVSKTYSLATSGDETTSTLTTALSNSSSLKVGTGSETYSGGSISLSNGINTISSSLTTDTVNEAFSGGYSSSSDLTKTVSATGDQALSESDLASNNYSAIQNGGTSGYSIDESTSLTTSDITLGTGSLTQTTTSISQTLE